VILPQHRRHLNTNPQITKRAARLTPATPQPPGTRLGAPTELVAVLLVRNGRDEIRFVPTCAGCGEIILDPTTANVAVTRSATKPGGWKQTPIGTHFGARVSRIEGSAFVYCWTCDAKQETNNVPWGNAAEFFRDRNDPAQQKLEPGFRSVSTRRAGYAR
jgi:hypothetical protein